MKTIWIMCAYLALVTVASAQQGSSEALKSVPAESVTVTDFYKQTVYDQNDKQIGKIADVLVAKDGKITAFVIGAGGFLGMDRHDVVVPFSAVKMTKKNDKNYLTMNTSKDALKEAPAFKYDRTATTWVPDTGNDTTGRGTDQRKRR